MFDLDSVDWAAVIVDEAHKIKNHRSQITQAMKEMRCKVRVGLTGTVLQNNLEELWCVMDWWDTQKAPLILTLIEVLELHFDFGCFCRPFTGVWNISCIFLCHYDNDHFSIHLFKTLSCHRAIPGCLGPLAGFKNRFSDPIEQGQKHTVTKRSLAEGRKAVQELAKKLSHWFLRRTKSLISDQLPKKDDRVS